MNKKQLKQLRKKIKPIQVEWLRELLPENQANTITVDNVEGLLPDQTHMFGAGQLHLSYMTDKWIMKRLKKYPHINTYKELKEITNNERI
jgi:hypothetical protein|tara:strand:- start:234 stop:503 length:270 start_codon:yes stop_codon:yes gene_type:complete